MSDQQPEMTLVSDVWVVQTRRPIRQYHDSDRTPTRTLRCPRAWCS